MVKIRTATPARACLIVFLSLALLGGQALMPAPAAAQATARDGPVRDALKPLAPLRQSDTGAMFGTQSENQSTILDRILDTAADNLRIAKILIQLGLDPDNVTYEAIFNRLLEVLLANITLANMCAMIGAVFFVATLVTKTMVPLRIWSLISNLFFMAFGALATDAKTFILYLLLLPINALRLYQMQKLVKMARSATKGDKSMEWLKPFMTERKYRQGDYLFRKGDAANEMFLTITGKFLVKEFNIELPPGSLMGELGFLTPNNRRTATIECLEAGHVLTIQYDKLLEIYFQNPEFGYYFLILTSHRLLENNAKLEAIIAENKIAPPIAVASVAD